MEPTVIIWTGENLGAFSVNVDQWKMMWEIWDGLRKVFWADGMRKKALILLAVVIAFVLIKLWFRRMDAKKRHENWENKERERARIWKEETRK